MGVPVGDGAGVGVGSGVAVAAGAGVEARAAVGGGAAGGVVTVSGVCVGVRGGTGTSVSAGATVAVGCGSVAALTAADGADTVLGSAGTGVSVPGAACSPPQAARVTTADRHSSSTVEASHVSIGLPHNDFMTSHSAPCTMESMNRPVGPPGVRTDAAGAGGRLCPVGARMVKTTRPGGRA